MFNTFITPTGEIGVNINLGMSLSSKKDKKISIGEKMRESVRIERANNNYVIKPKKPKKPRRILTEEEKNKNKEKYAKQKALKIEREEKRKALIESRLIELQKKKERSLSGRLSKLIGDIKLWFR
jgi:hypothetical protein